LLLIANYLSQTHYLRTDGLPAVHAVVRRRVFVLLDGSNDVRHVTDGVAQEYLSLWDVVGAKIAILQ